MNDRINKRRKAALMHLGICLCSVITTAAAASNPSAVAIPNSPPSCGRRALLDDNGSGVARIIETINYASSSLSSSSIDTDKQDSGNHPLSLKNLNKWKDRKRGILSHVKASILTIGLAVLLTPMVFSNNEMLQAHVPEWMREKVLLCIVAALYILECAFCSTRKYLSNSMSPSELQTYVQKLRDATPTITWFIECYHNREVRHYAGTSKNNDGRPEYTTRHETVVTYRAHKNYSFDSWEDDTITDTLDRAVALDGRRHQPNALNNANSEMNISTFVKASLSLLFVFSNSNAESKYFLLENEFINSQKWRDVFHKFQRRIYIPNFEKRKLLIVRTGLSDITFASPLWFWIASMLGMTVPYRIWFANHCLDAELTVTKKIGM